MQILSFTNCRGVRREKTLPWRVVDRYMRLCRRKTESAIRAGVLPRYRACSGQARGPRQWGVCDELTPSWRATASDGRTRLFASPKSAQRLADALNASLA